MKTWILGGMCIVFILLIAAMEIDNRIPKRDSNMLMLRLTLPSILAKKHDVFIRDITIKDIAVVSSHVTSGRLPFTRIAGEIYDVEYVHNKDETKTKYTYRVQVPNGDNWYLILKEFGLEHLLY